MQEHDFDVIVVGAGLSGIGAGYRLQTECPGKRYAILEARDAIGGTWDLFRYPGVRSDSDMFTLGYPFRPWTGPKSIADGASILQYIRDTAAAHGIDRHIRFRRRIVAAAWSSADARWTLDVEAQAGDARTPERYTCRFLYLCSGYYRYDAAHAPRFPGQEQFAGRIVHPQWWPQDLDYSGKQVVVIGSGATAVTLVPAMAERAAHVTMLQRSPTYIASLPARDKVADTLRRALPERAAYRAIRAKNVALAVGFYQFCRRFPDRARAFLTSQVAALLPPDVPVAPHFTPAYRPWDQRLCLVPDGDLFAAMRRGTASVVTDTIETFTEHGLRLASGRELPADIIVTATGLELLACGGIQLAVDGRTIELRDTLFYKGAMLSDVPNLAWCVGYINASWTLRADLASRFVCRLLGEMDRRGADQVVARAGEGAGEERPLLDLSSGYVARAAARFPKQGARRPWYLRQNYVLDLVTTAYGPVADRALEFGHRPHAAAAPPTPARSGRAAGRRRPA